jgi:hypothetical protein
MYMSETFAVVWYSTTVPPSSWPTRLNMQKYMWIKPMPGCVGSLLGEIALASCQPILCFDAQIEWDGQPLPAEPEPQIFCCYSPHE